MTPETFEREVGFHMQYHDRTREQAEMLVKLGYYVPIGQSFSAADFPDLYEALLSPAQAAKLWEEKRSVHVVNRCRKDRAFFLEVGKILSLPELRSLVWKMHKEKSVYPRALHENDDDDFLRNHNID